MGARAEDQQGSVRPRRSALGTARRRWEEVPAAWRRAIVAGVTLRVVVAVLSLLAVGLLEPLEPPSVDPVPGTDFAGWTAPHPSEQGIGLVGAGLERYDALWYLAIAEQGYPAIDAGSTAPGVYAFFPLLPLLIGVIGRLLFGHWLLAANVVAMAAAVASLAAVHRLVEEETGDQRLAGRALVALAVFPSAYFLVAPYTEALFLALSGWALVTARRGRWGLASGLAFLAALTRPIGVLLVVALVLEAWRQRRAGVPIPAAGWGGAALAAPAGSAAFLAWAWLRTGSPSTPLRAQQQWQREWWLPHETLREAVATAAAGLGAPAGGYHVLDLILFLPVVVAVVWLLARTPATYGVYAAAHLVVWVMYPFPGRPLMSTYRFALAIAPLSWAFAAWSVRRGVATGWWTVSGALLGAMTLLFVTGHFVF